MEKRVKTGLVLAVSFLVLSGMTACSSLGGGQAGVSQQLVKVERGDITVTVSGSGNIEATREARLTFGSAGKVDRILVKDGDAVRKGDLLARLDTSALELGRTQAEVALTQAEVAMTQAQLALKTAERSLKNTRDTQDTLELARLNAQISLDAARDSLSDTIKGYNWDNFETIDSELNKARTFYNYALEGEQQQPSGFTGDWELLLERATQRLEAAQAAYDNFLAGHGNAKINIKEEQVRAAEMSLAQSQKNLDKLADDITLQELQVTSANQTVSQAQESVTLAGQSLQEAQKQLDEATITAPFDGVIAQVLAKEGDSVPSPSVAPQAVIYMIDPVDIELVVDVDEIDIASVALNHEAKITLDALPNAEFKGVVSAIYPLPKEEGGVVLYRVRLSLDVPENSGIRAGMSASADISIAQHRQVLLVPSRAVTRNSSGQNVVRVMSGGKVQEKPVTVGLDDGQHTEILGGLSEGEVVVVESRVPSTSGLGMF